jgi:diguanylate cyclase (GGDEF)-like protein
VAAKKQESINSDKQILLIGDISKAFYRSSFVDQNICTNYRLVVMPSLGDAIGAAVLKDCTVVAIVISGNILKLKSSIKAIRNTCDSRIVLLAEMYEEPIAIRLRSSSYNSMPLVDDYLICPVQREEFIEFLFNPEDGDGEAGPEKTAAVDPAIETRIKHLEKLATEDDLTGLKNRRYIWEFSRQVLEHAGKENKRVTLLIFDIDDFKNYNDLYGHCAGDEVLKQAGALMRRCCRSHDVVGRIGGDEFAVIFWDDPYIQDSSDLQNTELEIRDTNRERRSASTDHPEEAILIAKRFVKELENAPASIGDNSDGGLGPKGRGILTISGGLASFPRDGSTIQELFQQADKALLEAKRSGKNRIYLVGSPQNSASSVESEDTLSS